MKRHSSAISWLIMLIAFILINSIIFVLITVQPRFEFSVQEQEDSNSVQISILRTSSFPFTSLEVLLDDEPLELTKLSEKVYSTTVTRNGTLEIRASNFNGMQKNVYEHIAGIDDTPPDIYGEITNLGVVMVAFEDSQSGINYETIYAIPNGNPNHIVPTSIDEEKNQAVFEYEGGVLEVHIFDHIGNEAIATFDDSTTETNAEESNEISPFEEIPETTDIPKESTRANAPTKSSSTKVGQTTKQSSTTKATTTQNSTISTTTSANTTSQKSKQTTKASSTAQTTTQKSKANTSQNTQTTAQSSKTNPTTTVPKTSSVTSTQASSSATTKASSSAISTTTVPAIQGTKPSSPPQTTIPTTDKAEETIPPKPDSAPTSASSNSISQQGPGVNP